MFFRLEKPMFLLMQYVGALQETKMGGRHFYLGACTQGKMDASHRRRTEGPTHTAGGFLLFFSKQGVTCGEKSIKSDQIEQIKIKRF